MKKCIYLLSFLLVTLSITTQLVADAFLLAHQLELIENEQVETEADSEKDVEKDKLFSEKHATFYLPLTQTCFLFQSDDKIFSSTLETDIDPPDFS